MADDTVSDILDGADIEVISWRQTILERAGYPLGDAIELAVNPEVDLHTAVYLLAAGCPLKVALRILL